MHPDLLLAVAKSQQHEMLRDAEIARKAREAPAKSRRSLTLPEFSLARRVGAIRARIAQTA